MLFIPNEPQINGKRPIGEYEIIPPDYSVTINGKTCPVRECRVSAIPFNCIWPGHQRDKSQSERAYFITFNADEPVNITVKCLREFKTAVVRPLSKKIETERIGDTVQFTLTQNGNYVFELDDFHFALHIFYNKINKYPEKENSTYYFGPGVHKPLLLNLKSNESVYIDPEAIVFTTVYAENAENIRIFGGGILDNSCQERIDDTCLGNYPIGNIRMYNCRNITIEDVILKDSANWVCALFNCKDVVIDNIKIIGQWRYNTDGIDLTNSSNVKIKNSFIRSFDDSICIKAANGHTVCEDFEIENCVLWCDWGKTLEIGLETAADEYRNIYYKNCDLIHNSNGALAISNGNYAEIHDIFYENINIELQDYIREQVYQEYDAMEYKDNGKTFVPYAIKISNLKMSLSYNEVFADERDAKPGYTHDIHFKNILIFCDSGIIPSIYLHSYSPDAVLENVYIENLVVNDEKVTALANLDITSENTRDIFLDAQKQL